MLSKHKVTVISGGSKGGREGHAPPPVGGLAIDILSFAQPVRIWCSLLDVGKQ